MVDEVDRGGREYPIHCRENTVVARRHSVRAAMWPPAVHDDRVVSEACTVISERDRDVFNCTLPLASRLMKTNQVTVLRPRPAALPVPASIVRPPQ